MDIRSVREIEVTAFKPSKLPVPPIRHGTWWPLSREWEVRGKIECPDGGGWGGVGWDLIGVWWRRSSSSQNPRPSPCRPLWLARLLPTDLDTDRVVRYVPTRWSIDLPGCSLGGGWRPSAHPPYPQASYGAPAIKAGPAIRVWGLVPARVSNNFLHNFWLFFIFW